MDFIYAKNANITVGQVLYGIICVSRYTYDGIFPVKVYEIDYNNEEVVFEVDQPCQYVSCSFQEMNDFVFESRETAKNKKRELDFGTGLQPHSFY